MRPIRVLATRRPLLVDAAVVMLLAAANGVPAAEAGLNRLGWIGFAACHAPLLWRRRAPSTVFWTILAVSIGCWTTIPGEHTFPIVPLAAAIHTVARHRTRLPVLAAAAASAVLVAGSWLSGGIGWRDAIALAAVLATAILAGSLLRQRNAYRRQRAERRRERQRLRAAAERAHIAAELHDLVSHNLSVMVALADGAGLTAATAPNRAAETLGTIADSGRICLAELRRLVAVLHEPDDAIGDPVPPTDGREPQPGLAQLPALVEQLRSTGLTVVLEQNEPSPDPGPGLELAAYRIVQESLTNVLNHAGPRAHATVHIDYEPEALHIRVTDDGEPRPRATDRAGRGLPGMSARAAAYGGDLEAGPLPGGGWQVLARLRTTP